MHSTSLKSSSAVATQAGVVNAADKNYYFPFGGNRVAPTAFSTLTTKRFTGQYHESTLPGGEGLSYYGARWYDAKLGRFLSADTIVPGAGNPQAFNRYSYVLNRPLVMIDPTGHAGIGGPYLTPGNGGSTPKPNSAPIVTCAGMGCVNANNPQYVSVNGSANFPRLPKPIPWQVLYYSKALEYVPDVQFSGACYQSGVLAQVGGCSYRYWDFQNLQVLNARGPSGGTAPAINLVSAQIYSGGGYYSSDLAPSEALRGKADEAGLDFGASGLQPNASVVWGTSARHADSPETVFTYAELGFGGGFGANLSVGPVSAHYSQPINTSLVVDRAYENTPSGHHAMAMDWFASNTGPSTVPLSRWEAPACWTCGPMYLLAVLFEAKAGK